MAGVNTVQFGASFSAAATATTAPLTYGKIIPIGSLVVATLTKDGTGIPSAFSDSVGNTFTAVPGGVSTSTKYAGIYYCFTTHAIIATTVLTATFATTTNRAIDYWWTPFGTSTPFDVASVGASTGTALSCASVTSTTADSLVITVQVDAGTTGTAPATNYTEGSDIVVTAATNHRESQALIRTATGSNVGGGTLATSKAWQQAQAVFKLNTPVQVTLDTTPLLDTFVGTSGALVSARAGMNAGTQHFVSGDTSWIIATSGNTTPNTTPASNWWGTNPTSADHEVSMTYGSGIDSLILAVRMGFSAGIATGGYIARISFSGTISIETGGTVVLASGTIAAPLNGDKFGLLAVGTQIYLWRKLAAGGGAAIIASINDTSTTVTGTIGFAAASGNTPIMQDFNGGNYSPTTPQLTGALVGNATSTASFAVTAPNPSVGNMNGNSNATGALAATAPTQVVSAAGAATATATFTVTNGPPTPPTLWGMPWNADSLNNIEIGSQVGRQVGLMFRAKTNTSLSRFAFALAYGSGYSLGTGGSVRVELFADDGSTLGAPTGSALATQTLSTPVGAPSTEAMIEYSSFTGAGTVVAGNLYHLVMTQMDASPTANWVSWDGTYNATPNTPQLQPAFANKDFQAKLYYSSAFPGWVDLTDVSPSPVNIHFADGTDLGWSVDYTPVAAALRQVGGVNRVRMNITPLITKATGKVWVRLYRQSGTTHALEIEIQNSSRTVLFSGTVLASSIISLASGSSPADGTWVSIPTTGFTVTTGTQFFLELSSPSETVPYEIYPMRTAETGNWSDKALTNRFDDGYWEYSTNSGSTWTKESSDTGYKMQFYFESPAAVAQAVGTMSGSATATGSLGVTAPSTLALGGANATATASLKTTVPTILTLASAVAVAVGSLSVTAPGLMTFSPGTESTTGLLNVTAPGIVVMGAANAQAIGVLTVSSPTSVGGIAASSSASASLSVVAPTKITFGAVTATAIGSLALTTPTGIGSLTASGVAAGSLSVTAPGLITFGSTTGVANGTLNITVPGSSPVGAMNGSATSVGSLGVSAPTGSGNMTSTAAAVGALTITAPAMITVGGGSATATALLTVTTPGILTFGAVAAVASGFLSTTGPTRIILGSAQGIATGAMTATAPANITFTSTTGVASAVLAVTAPMVLPFGSAAATATGSFGVSGPTTILFGVASVVTAGTLGVTVPGSSAVGSLNGSATSVGSLAVTSPTRIAPGSANASATGSLKATAPGALLLGAAAATATGALVVRAPGLIPLGAPTALAAGTLNLAAPATLQPTPALAMATGTLSVTAAAQGSASTRSLMGMGM